MMKRNAGMSVLGMLGTPWNREHTHGKSMLIRILNNHWMLVEQLSSDQIEVIDAAFSAKEPKARYIDTQADWDGWYHKFRQVDGRLSKAFLNELIELCDTHNYPYEIIDQRPSPLILPPDPNAVKADILPNITLFDYQLRLVRACCRHEIGLISSPTGSGKSEMMAAIIKMYRCHTVVIADQRIVIDQIKNRLELYKIAEEVGVFYAGKTPKGQVVIVGSIQSLSPPSLSLSKENPAYYKSRMKNSRILRALLTKCDLLIVDEADRASSKQFRDLFSKWYSGRRKYGFSGTPFDEAKPVQNLHLRSCLGNIIEKATREEVQNCGLIIPVKFLMLAIGMKSKLDRSAYDIAINEHIVASEAFHTKVASVVSAFPNDKTLIIVEVVDLGNSLLKAIRDRGITAEFIYGNTSSKKRWRAIHAFERGDIQCLIGGKIIKRGLDIKGGMDNLILCGIGKLWSDFDQRIGRAVRKNARGWARVFDFYFMNNQYLYDHSRSRLKAIVNMGYPACVVFGSDEVDAAQLIHSRFRIPKHIKGKYFT